jgi:hypothetical protein
VEVAWRSAVKGSIALTESERDRQHIAKGCCSRRRKVKMSYARFPRERLDLFSLAQSTKDFLHVVGLPTWAPGYLSFGPADGVFLPRLSEWTSLKLTPPYEIGSFIVIGQDGNDDPICIVQDSEQVVIIEQKTSFEQVLMNSTVFQLAATLNDYEGLVEEAIDTAGNAALNENRIPSDLVDEFEEELARRDPAALTPRSFWAEKIADHREGLKQFESRKKYHFRFFGRIGENEDSPASIEVKQVTIIADTPVLRAMGEFLSCTAHEIDRHGESFDHEHLRDHWREWYSAYPDMIVARPVSSAKDQE